MLSSSTMYAQEIRDNKINEKLEAEYKELLWIQGIRPGVSSEGSSFISSPVCHATGYEIDALTRFLANGIKQKYRRDKKSDINEKPLVKKNSPTVKLNPNYASSNALKTNPCIEPTLNCLPIETEFAPRIVSHSSGVKASTANISKVKPQNTRIHKSSEPEYLEPLPFSSGSSSTTTGNLTQKQNNDKTNIQCSSESSSEECPITSFQKCRLKLLRAFKRTDSAQFISVNQLRSTVNVFTSSSNDNVTSTQSDFRSDIQFSTTSFCEKDSITTFQANRLKLLEAFKREDSTQFISVKKLHSNKNSCAADANSKSNSPPNARNVVPSFPDKIEGNRTESSSIQSSGYSSSQTLSKICGQQEHLTSNSITQLANNSGKSFHKTSLLPVRRKLENSVPSNQLPKNTAPTPRKLPPETFEFINRNLHPPMNFQMESNQLVISSNDDGSSQSKKLNPQLQTNDLPTGQTTNLSKIRPKIPPKPALLSRKSPLKRIPGKSSFPLKDSQVTDMNVTEDTVSSVNDNSQNLLSIKSSNSESVISDTTTKALIYTERVHDDSVPEPSESLQEVESGSLEKIHRSSTVSSTSTLHYHRSESYLSSQNNSKGSTDDLEKNVSDVQNSSTESESDDFMMLRNYLDRPSLPLRTLPQRSLSCSSLVQTFKELSPNRIFSLTRNVKEIVKKKAKSHSVIESPKLEFLPKSEETEVPKERSPMSSSIPAFLLRKAWFHPVSSVEAKRRLLEMKQDGAFLMRPSSSGDGSSHTLCFTLAGRVRHCHVRLRRDGQYALGDEKENEKTYPTLSEIIQYHQDVPLGIKRLEGTPSSEVYLLITPPKYSTDST